MGYGILLLGIFIVIDRVPKWHSFQYNLFLIFEKVNSSSGFQRTQHYFSEYRAPKRDLVDALDSIGQCYCLMSNSCGRQNYRIHEYVRTTPTTFVTSALLWIWLKDFWPWCCSQVRPDDTNCTVAQMNRPTEPHLHLMFHCYLWLSRTICAIPPVNIGNDYFFLFFFQFYFDIGVRW